jgi:hypothetical protein
VTDEYGIAVGERTWRPSAWFRVRLSLLLAVAALVVAGTVGLPGWWVLAGAAPLWAWVVPRTWAVSATLTYDALIIRNVWSTRRIALEDIAEATFFTSVYRHGGLSLKVIDRAAGKRRRVTAVRLGVWAYHTSVRCDGDDAADAIRAAAGLPPTPPGCRA